MCFRFLRKRIVSVSMLEFSNKNVANLFLDKSQSVSLNGFEQSTLEMYTQHFATGPSLLIQHELFK